MDLIKRKKKILKSRVKSNLVYSKDFTFYKYRNINEFAKRSFYSKQNDLTEFKDTLDTFYYDIEKIKQNNEAQEKDLEKRKVVINKAFKLYDKLFNIYTTQHDKFSEDSKKKVNVLAKPESLTFDFD